MTRRERGDQNRRTDADFARLTRIGSNAVQKYRHAYDIFGDVSDAYPKLGFSHSRFATGCDDAEEWLDQASDSSVRGALSGF